MPAEAAVKVLWDCDSLYLSGKLCNIYLTYRIAISNNRKIKLLSGVCSSGSDLIPIQYLYRNNAPNFWA